jgi:hypothetical protein
MLAEVLDTLRPVLTADAGVVVAAKGEPGSKAYQLIPYVPVRIFCARSQYRE